MEIINQFNHPDIEIRNNVNLDKYTTIRLKAQGSIAICKSESGLRKLLEFLLQNEIKHRMIGWGANQVLVHTRDVLFIKLSFEIDKSIFEKEQNDFSLPASFPLNVLTSIAVKKGFSGWEVFTGIPASLGGAICMNAGTSLGEIGELIKSVRILKTDGSIYTYHCNEASFAYRKNNFLQAGEVILSAVISHKGIDKGVGEKITNYLNYRKETQPLTTKNCGSVFKNHGELKAGATIDQVGLKGFGTQNVFVSFKHANFIENSGEGTATEFEQMVHLLQEEIERNSGIKFEFEVKLY